ncbi:C-C motif chemokine 1 [Manis javanica]|nr:C-C motif chemokine 1 [Manis javanica]
MHRGCFTGAGAALPKMKLVTMALACLLLATMWLQDVDSKSMIVSSSNCCYTFVEKKISQKRIQCYRNQFLLPLLWW